MFVPKQFQIDESMALDIVTSNEFATVIDLSSQGGRASHLPLWLLSSTAGGYKFFGHFARANPQSETVANGGRVLAIFTGPHGYVSPSWYKDPQANVGTWDYQAVHVVGNLQDISGDKKLQLMRQFSEDYEDNWSLQAMPDTKRQQLLTSIVPFILQVETVTGVSKLSQNRSLSEQSHIAEQFFCNGQPELATLINQNVDNSINKSSHLTGELPND